MRILKAARQITEAAQAQVLLMATAGQMGAQPNRIDQQRC